MTLSRRQQHSVLEQMLFDLADVLRILEDQRLHLAQLQARIEHVYFGGDPAETRRDRWITRDDVKRRYKGKDSK
jgi:hypothetical protein